MKKLIVATLLAAWAAAVSAADALPEKKFERTATLNATVTDIDHKSRMVTLKGKDGNSVTFRVDDRVKNLPQVQKGDEVFIEYLESLTLRLKKPGETGPVYNAMETMDTAKPGAKPGGVTSRQVTMVATIEKIDDKAPSLTLKGPKGNMVELPIRDPKVLEVIKVGDKVEATYTEALAVKVEKPSAK